MTDNRIGPLAINAGKLTKNCKSAVRRLGLGKRFFSVDWGKATSVLRNCDDADERAPTSLFTTSAVYPRADDRPSLGFRQRRIRKDSDEFDKECVRWLKQFTDHVETATIVCPGPSLDYEAIEADTVVVWHFEKALRGLDIPSWVKVKVLDRVFCSFTRVEVNSLHGMEKLELQSEPLVNVVNKLEVIMDHPSKFYYVDMSGDNLTLFFYRPEEASRAREILGKSR